MSHPILSIVLPTYNAESQLERFFNSLENQDFPKKDLEVLMIDGGSTDTSLEIAQKHHIRVIHNPKKLAEPGVALGFEKARGELVMVLASDNIFKNNDALGKMVGVFQDKKIVGAFPKHDTGPGDTIWSRYVNTFTDPLTHFVYSDASNARTFKNIYATIEHNSIYDVYDYRSNAILPIIALAQGFTIRRSFISTRKETYDDVLAIYELIMKKQKIAYVHGISLYHYTADSLLCFIKKQSRAVDNAFVRKNSGISKRTSFLTFWQKLKQYLYIPYSVSIIVPICVSLYQYSRTREKIWLFHPIMVYISSIAILYRIGVIFVRRET